MLAAIARAADSVAGIRRALEPGFETHWRNAQTLSLMGQGALPMMSGRTVAMSGKCTNNVITTARHIRPRTPLAAAALGGV